jgi:hypothetical protein
LTTRSFHARTEDTIAARCCRDCNTDFPLTASRCLLCGGRLRFDVDGSPMPHDEFSRLRRAVAFERYYEQRERDRVRRGDPSPEELGRADAAAEREGRSGD